MKNDFLEFHWEVPPAGFQWIEIEEPPASKNARLRNPAEMPTKDVPHLALMPATQDGGKQCNRRYNPFEIAPALFLVFAQVRPVPAGILEFANQYGDLGVSRKCRLIDDGAKNGPKSSEMMCEPLKAWERAIRDMHDAICIWEMIQKGDKEGLARRIEWDQKRSSILFRGKGIPYFIASMGRDADWFNRFTPGDVFLPALVHLQREINKNLEAKASPRLLWDMRGNDGLVLRFLPARLLTMLWLQFADVVSGKKVYHACQGCGKWLLISPGTARTNRQFCSNACRMKALRARQEQARHLHATGESIDMIAEKLSSDVLTITGWVKGRSEIEKPSAG